MNNIQVQQNLVPLLDKEFNGEIIKTISARDLHQFLESKYQFADWIKMRIERYGFEENIDYIHISEKSETRTGATISQEYYLTISTAKEIAMLENNDKGKDVRKYFIECERKLKENIKPMSQLEIVKFTLDKLIEQEKKQKELENRMLLLEAKNTSSSVDFYSISGFAKIKNIKLTLRDAVRLGKEASKLSKELGAKVGEIPDQKYGSVQIYNIDILEEIFNNIDK